MDLNSLLFEHQIALIRLRKASHPGCAELDRTAKRLRDFREAIGVHQYQLDTCRAAA